MFLTFLRFKNKEFKKLFFFILLELSSDSDTWHVPNTNLAHPKTK